MRLLSYLGFALLLTVSAAAYADSDDRTSKPRKPKTKIIVEQPFPKFPEGTWLNSKPLTEKKFKDKLTLVYFWDYTSINSIREIKPLQLWHEQYRPYGLQLIWVHAPEFAVSSQEKNVKDVVKKWKIEEPVFLDNQFKLWEALEVKSWPTKFLINEEGKIIFSQIGEGRFSQMEEKIRSALLRLEPASVLPEPLFYNNIDPYNPEVCGDMSAETYLGYKRSTWWGAKIANRQWVPENEVLNFKDRGDREEKGFFAEGLWANREDYLEHARETAEPADYIGILYRAREVYAVLHDPQNKPARVYITRDEMPVPVELRGLDIQEDEDGETYLIVQEPRLYYLIALEDDETHELKLWTTVKGLAVHSFSFSNACLSEFEHR
jgi:thiol-disulfide isomerase/thioredoxin